ncbi:hypothetical protein V6B16_14010 [Salinimicrobium catena]|uniref:hypothetical protein n=1 Tax=Salinimicrobium catena TaxID=390640 RepID=UPI002FE4B746
MNQNQNTIATEEAYSNLPVGAQEAIQKVDVALQKVHAITATGYAITNQIAQTVVEVKQMQLAIQQMDSQVEIICKEYDMRIEKNKLIAPIIQSQLTSYSSQMDQLLKTILEMDPSSKDEEYIRYRSELISTLNGASVNISNMFMNFIMC